MFETVAEAAPGRPSPEAMARMEEYFERCYPTETTESVAWLEGIAAYTRLENRAAAAVLVRVGELFAYRISRCSDREDEWAADTESAVAAEVAAMLRISQGLAASRVRYARAMRERPKVAALFCAGSIDFAMFKAIVLHTELITDPAVAAQVDERLAVEIPLWPPMGRGRFKGQIDRIVAKLDPDAVRRRKDKRADRDVFIGPSCEGVCEISGSVFDTVGPALDQRLNALAATVCARDPRTRAQRRSDAMEALVAKADRIACTCDRADCAAEGKRPASPVVIHVIAEAATLGGRSEAPGWQVGAEGLITADVVAELADSAKLVPLIHPGDAPAEPHYEPSKKLADFVRCRDLTCRWPGCDRPAWGCQLDHTIPHAEGGPTHASNLKCYCSGHHLMKTFWGWTDKQLADGTLILTSPSGQTYVTYPGSALMFPSLCRGVLGIPCPEVELTDDYCGQRTAMMPRRRRTRDQDRAARIAAERKRNHKTRTDKAPKRYGYWGYSTPNPDPDEEPPPF